MLSSDRLLFAVPKKGRIYEKCLSILNASDIQFTRHNRLDIAQSTNLPVTLVFLPAKDIARFVAEGEVDLGITGQDIVCESQEQGKVDEVLNLGFGKCSLCFQVPVNSEFTSPEQLVGKRIATTFENVTEAYFKEKEGGNLTTDIRFLSGSVEVACSLGLADAVVDLVESGESMRAAGLRAIGKILETESVLIANKKSKHKDLADKIVRRIKGVLAAAKFVLCEYNVPREKLKEAISITPGKTAPTLAPLERDGWVSVGVMIETSRVNEILDQLETVGAKDILVMNLSNCRV